MTALQSTPATIRDYARKFFEFGFNVIPLGADKRPIMLGQNGSQQRFKWDKWQRTPLAISLKKL